MKTILIMRHGDAEALQRNDEMRALTELGNKQAQQVGEWLAQRFNPDALLVSPYVRAQQTAAQVKGFYSAFGYEETTADIIPSGDAQRAIDYVKALIELHPQLDTWLIVAHMPIVSYMVAQLCPDKMPIFPTCGVAHIDFDETSNTAHWRALYSPQE
ncbi:phosphohistidine phosphatase SixA [Pseudoalteromonas sp. SSDWG2]|uniref:phosphohistidine phosphatase SixA n=1 Tax=Pseudoalteromonas sp. SSDWG2 TaxID=3139391 RepID=UPI003BABF5BF